MVIISRPHDVRKTNYNQLKGSGLLRVGPICELAKCKPIGLSVPNKPVPMNIRRPAPKPLVAVKKSQKSNKWTLNGICYPTFNSLWVNIPRGSFTVLKTNG